MNNKWNGVLLGILSVLMVTLASGADAKMVGVSFTQIEGDDYLKLLSVSIAAEIKKTPDLQLEMADAKSDVKVQLAQIEAMVAKHPDALIVFMSDRAEAKKVNELARKAKIPVVYLLGIPLVDNLPNNAAVVMSNGLVAGRLQMMVLASHMGGQGNIVVLRGNDTSADAIDRTAGVKEMAKKFPNIHIVEDASAGWSQATAEKLVTEWLAKGDKIDAVLANNDSMALGAIDALEKAKLTKVLVGGVDGQAPATFAAMQKGKLTLTVRQNAAGQGAEAVLDAISLMAGKPVQQYDWVPFELVTQEVLPAYVSK